MPARLLAGPGFDPPAVRILVIDRGADAPVEADVAAQIESIGDEVEIAAGLRLGGEFLRPVPFVDQFLRPAVGIAVALRIEARAGIAVPVPGPADAVGSLEGADRQAQLADAVQRVEAGDAGADD